MVVKQLGIQMPDYPSPDLDNIELVDVLKAVADPVRLHIVRLLADGNPKPKSPHGWGVDVTKATMAHHFRILREAGLTLTLVSGRTHSVQLRRAELDARFPGLITALVEDSSPLRTQGPG